MDEAVSASRSDSESAARESIAAWLMALLVCPVDHGALREEASKLVCTVCGRRYPVRDGIPVLLAEEAKKEHPFA